MRKCIYLRRYLYIFAYECKIIIYIFINFEWFHILFNIDTQNMKNKIREIDYFIHSLVIIPN